MDPLQQRPIQVNAQPSCLGCLGGFVVQPILIVIGLGLLVGVVSQLGTIWSWLISQPWIWAVLLGLAAGIPYVLKAVKEQK